jgi:hypothetical protein
MTVTIFMDQQTIQCFTGLINPNSDGWGVNDSRNFEEV